MQKPQLLLDAELTDKLQNVAVLKYEKFKQQILRERQALVETADELKGQIDAKTSDLLSYSTESKIEALDRMARLE